MRTETRTVSIGEWLGPVDWSFDFKANAPHYGTTPERAAQLVQEKIEQFREMAEGVERGERWEVYYGTIWQEVSRVGMYDGWPYWKPYPTLAYLNYLGENRLSWSHFTSAQRIGTTEADAADAGQQ